MNIVNLALSAGIAFATFATVTCHSDRAEARESYLYHGGGIHCIDCQESAQSTSTPKVMPKPYLLVTRIFQPYCCNDDSQGQWNYDFSYFATPEDAMKKLEDGAYVDDNLVGFYKLDSIEPKHKHVVEVVPKHYEPIEIPEKKTVSETWKVK